MRQPPAHTRSSIAICKRRRTVIPALYRVIIRAKAGQRGAVAQMVRQRGHAVYGDHSGIDGLSVEVSGRTLRELEKNSNVESISTDADLDALGPADKK